MPGKNTPSSIRIRDNQRRSRTRRAEHLQNLQKRVQEYERQGVAATLEVQQAARKVARDNVRLRALLALYGVSSEEVDTFLRSSDEGSTSEANLPSFQRKGQRQVVEKGDHHFSQPADSTPVMQGQFVAHKVAEVDSQPALDAPNNHSAQHVDAPQSYSDIVQTGASSPETIVEYVDLQGHGDSNDRNHPCPAIDPSDCPNSFDCFCAPPHKHLPISSGLQISCEAAATIIAEMRGDGDRASIRASLGCHGQDTCTIKNSTVLQVMDSE